MRSCNIIHMYTDPHIIHTCSCLLDLKLALGLVQSYTPLPSRSLVGQMVRVPACE